MNEDKKKIKQYTRRDERRKTRQALYQVIRFAEKGEDYDATQIILDRYSVKSLDLVPPFSLLLYVTALDHYDEIKKRVSDHLVNWTFDRIDDVLKGLLFRAIAEGKYVQITPRKVVINEAVNLAKDFLSEEDYKFVNALLDKVIPDYVPKE